MNNAIETLVAEYVSKSDMANNAIEEATRNLLHLKQERSEAQEKFFSALVGEGWSRCDFRSSYIGSHPEYGYGDEKDVYFFRSGIDFSRWEGENFGHSSHGDTWDSNIAFDQWLEALGEGQHLCFPDYREDVE